MPNKPILVTASFEKGRGSGHLVRCGLLVRDLRKLGREAILYLPGLGTGRTPDEARAVLSQVIEDPADVPIVRSEADLCRDWAIVVFDRFATPPQEFERFAAPSLGIDEGGRARRRFDFLLDLLPNLPSLSPPNELRPDLLCLPSRRREGRASAAPTLKILVTFGGEDAAKLGLAAARACAAPGLSEVTLIVGALNGTPNDARSDTAITRVPSVKNLRDKLADYGLVVTHFGICAFEALYANVPVLLVSPSPLHERLARSAGLVSAGRGIRGAERLAKLVFTAESGGVSKMRLNTASLEKIALRCAALARRYGLDEEQRETLAVRIDRLEPKTSPVCPLCEYAKPAVSVRFAGRTYRRCPRCGTLYMNRSEPPDIRYTEAYFFENYKKQYGKTYLEDFPNLTAMARQRLALIKTLAGNRNGRRLLDIGCAYGAFVLAARDEGFDCVGIDGGGAAVDYVRDKLKMTAFQGFFPETVQESREQFRHKFDVITLWYVLEHFETARAADGSCAVKTALEKIHGLLNTGGILAFSTPNLRGISGRLSQQKFLEKSPADHWTVWSERSVKKILPRFGFTVKRIVVTGHHPERFPFCSRLTPRSFLYKAVAALSGIFRLGDTFEVYATAGIRKRLPTLRAP
jgi:2-polyprenyl-3-methyl-5-hydroxy-6-metoxy-1,4-benzoquinol methylase